MKKLAQTFIATVALMVSAITSANATQDYILWITWEQRPILFTHPKTGQLQGIYKNIIDYLHSAPELTRYQQRHIMVNHSRFNRIAQSPDNCYLGWVTYDDQRVESRPITMIKPWAIWTLQKHQDRFGEPDSLLSLEKLIQDPTIKVGIIKYFTYSEPVLALLEKHRDNPSIIVANTSAIEINPRTLDAGRVDVFLGNPGQMQRKKSDPVPDVEYIKYGILEDNRHREMLVSCADDPKGRVIIENVNKIINRTPDQFYSQILSFHNQWLGEITPSFMDQFKEKVHSIDFEL